MSDKFNSNIDKLKQSINETSRPSRAVSDMKSPSYDHLRRGKYYDPEENKWKHRVGGPLSNADIFSQNTGNDSINVSPNEVHDDIENVFHINKKPMDKIANRLSSGEIEPVLMPPTYDADHNIITPSISNKDVTNFLSPEGKDLLSKIDPEYISNIERTGNIIVGAKDPSKTSGKGVGIVNYTTLAAAMGSYYDINSPLIIFGEPGLGKTSVVSSTAKQIAVELGKPFFDFNAADAVTQKMFMWPGLSWGTSGETILPPDPDEEDTLESQKRRKQVALTYDMQKIIRDSFTFILIKMGNMGEEVVTGIPSVGLKWLEQLYMPWVYAVTSIVDKTDRNGKNVDGIICLDEMLQAPGGIQNAFMAFMDEQSENTYRLIGTKHILQGFRIFGTSNFSNFWEAQGVLKGQISTRASFVILVLDPVGWLKFCKDSDILHPILYEYMNAKLGDPTQVHENLRIFYRQPGSFGGPVTDDSIEKNDITWKTQKSEGGAAGLEPGAVRLNHASPRSIVKFSELFNNKSKRIMALSSSLETRDEKDKARAKKEILGLIPAIRDLAIQSCGEEWADEFINWLTQRMTITIEEFLEGTRFTNLLLTSKVANLIAYEINDFIDSTKIIKEDFDPDWSKLKDSNTLKRFTLLIGMIYKFIVPGAIEVGAKDSTAVGRIDDCLVARLISELQKAGGNVYRRAKVLLSIMIPTIATNVESKNIEELEKLGDSGKDSEGKVLNVVAVAKTIQNIQSAIFPENIKFLKGYKPSNIGVACVAIAKENKTYIDEAMGIHKNMATESIDVAALYLNSILGIKLSESDQSILATNAKYSYLYAKNVLKDRFNKGESAINESVEYGMKYDHFINIMPIKCTFNKLYENHNEILSDIQTDKYESKYNGNYITVGTSKLLGAIVDKYNIATRDDYYNLIVSRCFKGFEKFKFELLALTDSIDIDVRAKKVLRKIIGKAKDMTEIFYPLTFFYTPKEQ